MTTANTPPTTPDRADVLLVTVTEVERQAVLNVFNKQLQRTFVRRFDGNKTYFYLGQVREAHTFLVQSQMGSGGVDGSMLTVSDSIRALNPSAIIMVGIAFGVDPEKQRIGQILVANKLRAYDLQRVGTGLDGGAVIVLRGDRPSASSRLVDRFDSGKADWKGAKVSFGLVLSGDKLIDQQDFRDQLRAGEPEAIGGEMEGAGLYAVAQREKVDWILVKAICDYADGNKTQDKDKRQQTAARNAARFVFHVLNQGGFATHRAGVQPVRSDSTSATAGTSIAGDVGTLQQINVSGGSIGSIVGSQTVYGASQPAASASQEAIEQQRTQLDLHRRTLSSYLLRLARLGSAYAPPEIDHGIREAREGIWRCKSTLRGWGVTVTDHPDDGPEPLGSSTKASSAQGVLPPQPADSAGTPAGRSRRCADLAANIGEALKLIKQYDDQRRLADDPRVQRRAENAIEDLRAQLATYQQEQRELGCEG
jgi:nucleoside phosphorylase